MLWTSVRVADFIGELQELQMREDSIWQDSER